MAVTISFLSQKGGTGKTTAVRTLADVFGRAGMDVLAIDADPQGNLTDYFDVDPDAEPTLADVLGGRASARDAVHGKVIPANLSLAESELQLAGKIGRELILRHALRELRAEHELILIDCPPTLGLLTVNALAASTHAVFSTEAQYFSLQGMEQAMEVMEAARDTLNSELQLLGLVLNIANMRTRHAREARQILLEEFGSKLFGSIIRQSISYAESAQKGVPILDHRPDRGVDYVRLGHEMLDRLGMRAQALRLRELEEALAPGSRLAGKSPQEMERGSNSSDRQEASEIFGRV